MPSKKKKYNARFPPARIKKIMQSDEEVGKVAQAVPVIISRALELFVENLLTRAETVTTGRNAKTLTPSHLKQCIMAEQRFDFLKDLVAAIPDVQGDEDGGETPTPLPTPTPRSSTATASSVSASPFVFPPSGVAAAAAAASAGGGAASTSVITPTPLSFTRGVAPAPTSFYHSELPPSMGIATHTPSVIVSHSSILNPPRVNSSPYIPTNSAGALQLQAAQPPPRPLSHFEYLPTNLVQLENNGFGLTIPPGVSASASASHPLSLSMRTSTSSSSASSAVSPGVIVYDKSASGSSGTRPKGDESD